MRIKKLALCSQHYINNDDIFFEIIIREINFLSRLMWARTYYWVVLQNAWLTSPDLLLVHIYRMVYWTRDLQNAWLTWPPACAFLPQGVLNTRPAERLVDLTSCSCLFTAWCIEHETRLFADCDSFFPLCDKKEPTHVWPECACLRVHNASLSLTYSSHGNPVPVGHEYFNDVINTLHCWPKS